MVAYVTCSPHPAETRAVVDDVLRSRSDVTRLDARTVMAGIVAADHQERPDPEFGAGPDVQLWTHVHGTDSMYLALLRRN